MYKGIDVLIDSVASCVAGGLDIWLVVIGDGKYRAELETRAATRGIANRVRFAGYLKREKVTAELDGADIFVLPSRQEGLPRALVEAMARALPCIASNVGGIPEVLAASDQVEPNNVDELSLAIKDVVLNVCRRAEMSRRNLIRANDFIDERLRVRRNAFYVRVRAQTEAWTIRQARL
jgi:glycosyltransferase involved in cell wall biosynthesis